jgi:hypothetical protein
MLLACHVKGGRVGMYCSPHRFKRFRAASIIRATERMGGRAT